MALLSLPFLSSLFPCIRGRWGFWRSGGSRIRNVLVMIDPQDHRVLMELEDLYMFITVLRFTTVGETSKYVGCRPHIQQPAAANLYGKSCIKLVNAAAFWLQPTVMNSHQYVVFAFGNFASTNEMTLMISEGSICIKGKYVISIQNINEKPQLFIESNALKLIEML